MRYHTILSLSAAVCWQARPRWRNRARPCRGRYGEITLQAGFPGRSAHGRGACGRCDARCFIWGHGLCRLHHRASHLCRPLRGGGRRVQPALFCRLGSRHDHDGAHPRRRVSVCDDDSAGNLGPGITVENPDNGAYEIWVGTFSSGAGYPRQRPCTFPSWTISPPTRSSAALMKAHRQRRRSLPAGRLP